MCVYQGGHKTNYTNTIPSSYSHMCVVVILRPNYFSCLNDFSPLYLDQINTYNHGLYCHI